MGFGWPIARERSPPADVMYVFFGNDHACRAGIGLLLSSALPNQIAQTAPTSSMAASAALNRRPASSVMYMFPYAIVTSALSRLAGPSPLAPRPCMHQSGDRAHPPAGRSAHGMRRARVVCRIDHARLRGVQASAQLSGWSLR